MKALMDLCNAYKNGEFNIKEFQQRIETIYLPDECKNTLEKEQYNACNRLEEIMYSYSESRKKYADEVADDLIQAALREQDKITNVS